MTGSAEILAQAKRELARVERERTQVREQQMAEIARFDEEIRRLRAAIRGLGDGSKTPRRQRSAAVQAGPKALDAVRKALARGPLSQAQIVKHVKLNDGTVSYALRALVESNEVVETGERIKGSREFRLRASKTRAA